MSYFKPFFSKPFSTNDEKKRQLLGVVQRKNRGKRTQKSVRGIMRKKTGSSNVQKILITVKFIENVLLKLKKKIKKKEYQMTFYLMNK